MTLPIRAPSLFLPALLIAGGLSAQVPDRPAPQHGALWIDPVKTEPAGTHYKLFATPSRGPDTQASYLIYLPPDYEEGPKPRRYPVLYWLHGRGGSQREGAGMVERIDLEIREGKLPPFLIVLPQGLPELRYINSKDGTRPLEDVVIKDLIPHIDATYRTLPGRSNRAIEGMSMGGFGALRLGFKFPDLFGIVSAVAPSIREIKDELPADLEPFGNDQAYYDEVGPWAIVSRHAVAIRGRTTVRLLAGDQDVLFPLIKTYSQLLVSLNIDHQFVVAPGAHHRYAEIMGKLPFDALSFWKTAFSGHG